MSRLWSDLGPIKIFDLQIQDHLNTETKTTFERDTIVQVNIDIWMCISFSVKVLSSRKYKTLQPISTTILSAVSVLVSYLNRWSFSSILGPLHLSSLFLTSREHKNIVQLCTISDLNQTLGSSHHLVWFLSNEIRNEKKLEGTPMAALLQGGVQA